MAAVSILALVGYVLMFVGVLESTSPWPWGLVAVEAVDAALSGVGGVLTMFVDLDVDGVTKIAYACAYTSSFLLSALGTVFSVLGARMERSACPGNECCQHRHNALHQATSGDPRKLPYRLLEVWAFISATAFPAIAFFRSGGNEGEFEPGNLSSWVGGLCLAATVVQVLGLVVSTATMALVAWTVQKVACVDSDTKIEKAKNSWQQRVSRLLQRCKLLTMPVGLVLKVLIIWKLPSSGSEGETVAHLFAVVLGNMLPASHGINRYQRAAYGLIKHSSPDDAASKPLQAPDDDAKSIFMQAPVAAGGVPEQGDNRDLFMQAPLGLTMLGGAVSEYDDRDKLSTALSNMATAQPPVWFAGRYEVQDLLTHGGQAVVAFAKDASGWEYAIKCASMTLVLRQRCCNEVTKLCSSRPLSRRAAPSFALLTQSDKIRLMFRSGADMIADMCQWLFVLDALDAPNDLRHHVVLQVFRQARYCTV